MKMFTQGCLRVSILFRGERQNIRLWQIDVKSFKKGNEINVQDEDLKRRKLFVKGLPNSCDKHKLLNAFKQFGCIDKAYILYDHVNGSSRGFGFVEFLREEDLLKSLEVPVTIDGKTIKCSRVFLKQEAKNSSEITAQNKTIVHSCQASSNNDQKPQALPSNKIESSKPKKFKGKHLNLKGSHAWTKNTKESSGASSHENKESNDFTEDYLNQESNEINQWHSPKADAEVFFDYQYQHSHQVYDAYPNFYEEYDRMGSGAKNFIWPTHRHMYVVTNQSRGFPGAIGPRQTMTNVSPQPFGGVTWSQDDLGYRSAPVHDKSYTSNASLSASKVQKSYYRMF